MATRSVIAYEHLDTGNIYAVYCNYDGYLEHTGVVLHTLYNQAGKVKQLILHSDMQTIFTKNTPSITIPDRPITGVPDYYAKDKETYLAPHILDDVHALLQFADEVGAKYVYLYQDNDWFVSKPYYKDMSFKLLEQALQEDTVTDFKKLCQDFHDIVTGKQIGRAHV